MRRLALVALQAHQGTSDDHGDPQRTATASRGLSLDTAADLAGVSRRQLYSVLSGERDATVGWLEKLADVLEFDVADFLKPRPPGD